MGNVITQAEVEAAATGAQRHLDLPQGAIVTPAARDRAHELGIELRPRSQTGNGSLSTSTDNSGTRLQSPRIDASNRAPAQTTPGPMPGQAERRVIFEKVGHFARITLNRPEAMNAMDVLGYTQMRDALRELLADDDLSCAVITGAGDRAFTAGGDLKGYAAKTIEQWREDHYRASSFLVMELNELLINCSKPLIAAVNGICVGWGMVVLLSTDIRIAAPHARFGSVGRMGGGMAERLPRQVPYAVAMRLLLSGKLLTAQEAQHFGLINEVVEADQLLATAEKVTEDILRVSPLMQRSIKRAVRRSYESPLGAAIAATQSENLIYWHTDDYQEGLRAFVEKRAPVWKKH